MILMNEKQTALDKAGGRKAAAFYATLASCLLLALLDKAKGEVLGLIDTLFFIYAGANVMSKRTPPQPKEGKKNE
tara:strand:- start:9 stop:233 length:225 start_codon:yes stop_codon:yes gene_type:complete